MNDKIKQHILNKSFGLKNFNRTLNKYQNYKEEQTQEFFKEQEEELNFYINDTLKDLILNKLFEKKHIGVFSNTNLNKKSDLNHLKTWVNSITYNLNQEFIKELSDERTNTNEIKTRNIIFYLRFYNPINEVMKNAYIEFIEELFNIQILENLN